MKESGFRERQSQRLRRLRAEGMRPFVIRVGVLWWGLPVWMMYSISDPLLDRWLSGRPTPSPTEWALDALLGLPIWLVLGYFYGRWLWRHGPA